MTRSTAREIAIQLGFAAASSGEAPQELFDSFFERGHYDTLAAEDELYKRQRDEYAYLGRRAMNDARGAAAEQKLPHIVKCVSPFYYEGDVRQSLLRYKFGGVRAYCDIYAEFLVKTIDERAVSCDIITWVPLNAKRLRRRGYDQARLIAEETAKLMGVECVQLLTKTHGKRLLARFRQILSLS